MRRYGAPYLVLHRADLQGVLLDRVRQTDSIELRLGAEVEDVATHAHGVTATLRHDDARAEETGLALIGADGVWSSVRGRLFGGAAQFSGKIAWRGTLDAFVDAKGQRTSWERDLNGRVTREIRADGTTDTLYTYDLAGRLKTMTDPLDQVTTYTYNIDDSLASTGFTNETIATPDIAHTYDAYYPRPTTMVDGNGTTTYSYVAPGTNGAGQLASVNGPFTNDTISYTYDALGRVLTRLLNGTGTEITYDALGRLSQLEFPIGAFDYTYVGHTGRRASVTYPNDQTTTYSYLDEEHDFRLQTIHHKNPSAATLSKFDYTYDDVGNILTWRQERAGASTKIYTFTYDLADQLTNDLIIFNQ